MDPELYEPQRVPSHWPLIWSAYSIAASAFWLWMFYDAYKRRGGFDTWHWLFIFMAPSTVVYFLLNVNQIFSGRGGGLFSPSVKGRIKKAQQQLRISDTLAVRAELGELFFQDGKYEECEAEFQRVLAAEPQNLEALYYTGLCKMKRGDSAGALTYLQQVMDRDKKLRFGVAWLRFTECLVAAGRKDEALEERKKLSRAFPRPLTEFAYAQLLNDAGKRDEARAVLEEMLATSEHAPSEDRTWLKQGRTLLKQVA